MKLLTCLLCVVQEELRTGEEIARCPSCSLYITVIYDPVSAVLSSTLCLPVDIPCMLLS